MVAGWWRLVKKRAKDWLMFGELIFGEENLFFDVKQLFICLLIIDMCKKRTGEMNE